MPRVIKFNDEQASIQLAIATRVYFVPGVHQSIASVKEDGLLCGGVLFTDYCINSIAVHVAGFVPNWLDKALLYLAFDYPFNKLGVNKLILTIRETNLRSRRFASNLGFDQETYVRDVFPDCGMVVLSMYKEQCRFLSMPRPNIIFEGIDGQG